jgi:hypothetical protein
MLTLTEIPTTSPHPRPTRDLRSVRPSLVDLRFTGDPWVLDHRDGTASLLLNNFRLARLAALSLDLPGLNRLLSELRLWQARRQTLRRARRVRC